jgi:apolipoprotein N-acyltransferase
VAGQDIAHLNLTTQRGEKIRAGALVCYEDVFPSLGREHALAGAQLMIVVTNDAWYGREAGAYQHNAHSVLLAAATGIPILRCGNAGWSGFIDSRGRMTALTQGEDPTIYFSGSGRIGPVAVKGENTPPTFWVKQGDFAIALGGLFFALTAFWRRQQKS